MPEQFCIAHLSDLHLTATDDGHRSEPKFTGHLRGMNDAFRTVANSEEVQNSDLVLVTGDITDTGDPDAWHKFKSIIDDAGLTDKTLAILGNHDVCDLSLLGRIGLPDELAQDDLERARQGLVIAGQETNYPWAKVVDPRIVIFGMDTNNSGNLSPIGNAVGKIGFHQMLGFASLLRKYKDVPVKIVAIHHSPNIPQKATAIRRGNSPMPLIFRWTHEIPEDDRRTLRLLCVSHGVRLLLHGHLHSAEDRRVNGLRIIGAPATTEPIKPKAKHKHYEFYKYTVSGPKGRVTTKLITV